jgi:hypothetical protein
MNKEENTKEFQLAHKEFEFTSALRYAVQSPMLNDEELFNLILETLGKSHTRDFLKTANELFNQIQ